MKTVVVTGATSGIGLAIVKEMLAAGWQVIGIGHSARNCSVAQVNLAGWSGAETPVYFVVDLMQQREIGRLSAELGDYLDRHCGGRLDALINNAGCVRSWFTTTEEGYEQQFALNHLAGFLLSRKLTPWLSRAGGRILFTGSGSHHGAKIHWQDVMYSKAYHPLLAYKQSKLCNLLTALELNRRLAPQGIRAYVVDPGLVRTDIGNKETSGLVNLVWTLRKRQGDPPEIPAKTYAYLCRQAEHPVGLCYRECRSIAVSRQVNDEDAQRLFVLSERLCGLDPGIQATSIPVNTVPVMASSSMASGQLF